jgi:hypothetical protein
MRAACAYLMKVARYCCSLRGCEALPDVLEMHVIGMEYFVLTPSVLIGTINLHELQWGANEPRNYTHCRSVTQYMS